MFPVFCIACRLRDSVPESRREGVSRRLLQISNFFPKRTDRFRGWYGQLSRIFGHAREPVIMSLRRHCALFVLYLLCILCPNYLIVSAFSKSELLFPYGETVSDQRLVNETDDFNSIEVKLTTPVVFYEQTYNSIYVS
jgi:hypothetical protein